MVAVFAIVEIYTNISNLGILPSGVSLGLPPANIDEPTGRCVVGYPFTEDDQIYLLGFEGVELRDTMPEDWYYPEC